MEYGVQTHNKFAFLDEDVSDPEDTLTKAEEEKRKAVTLPPEKKVVKPAVVTKSPAAATLKEGDKHEKKDNEGGQGKPTVKFRNERGGGSGANRDREQRDVGQNRGGGPPRQRRPQQSMQNEGFDSQIDREKRMPNGRPLLNNEYNNKDAGMDGRPPRRTGPPRGDGGGGRGQRGGYGGGPRGGGNRRFRNMQEENKTEDSKPKESEDPEEKSATENDATNGIDGLKVNDENVDIPGEEKKGDLEEEDQTPRGKTYEEYKAELNQKQIEAVQFNTRKPGEGGDEKIYQKLVPLKKPDNKNKKLEDMSDETAQHKEKREKTLSIDVAFVDKRFGGPTRTGFGGGGVDRNNERPPPRGDRDRGDYRQGGGGGGDRDRQGQREGGGSGRGGGGPGRGAGGPPRNNYGAAGSSNRRPPNKQGQTGEFTLENDQFPALGAK